MSQILASCETPIQWEQFCLVFIANRCSIWYFIQFVQIAIFKSLHGLAGACIPVASVFSIQHVLKHCGAQTHINIHTRDNLRTPQLAGFACHLGCKKTQVI